MIRRLLLALGLCCVAFGAHAQTVFSTDCAAGYTITNGGLTVQLTSPTGPIQLCRASTYKYGGPGGGLLYFEFTLNNTPTTNETTRVGLVNGGGGFPIQGGTTTAGPNPGSDANGVGIDIMNLFDTTHSVVWYVNFHTSTMPAPVAGNKGAMVVNFNNNPPQVWATPNIANLVCDGAGSSGTTNPMWNGDCANDPNIAGTGHPAASGGGVFLPGYNWSPAIGDSGGGSPQAQVTFNFNDDPTLDALLPISAKNWDGGGSGYPTPGPSSPATINVANAPPWAQSTALPLSYKGVPISAPSVGSAGSSYADGDIVTLSGGTCAIQPQLQLAVSGGTITGFKYVTTPGACTSVPNNPVSTTGGSGSGLTINVAVWATMPDRVVAGPGLTGSTGAFTDGQPLYVLEVTTAGTTAATGNGPTISSCPSTGITDGTVVYKCVSVVDNITLTDLFNYTSQTWATSSGSCSAVGAGCYLQYDVVLNPNNGNFYQETGTSSTICASATSGTGPSGTTWGVDNTDNGCTWQYRGHHTWWLGTNVILHQARLSSGPMIQMNYNTTINIYRGGGLRPRYQPGQNGESDPLVMSSHLDLLFDLNPSCLNGSLSFEVVQFVVGGATTDNCFGTLLSPTITMQAASGEDFASNVSPTAGPLSVDATKGVTLYSNSTPTNNGTGAPIDLSDSQVTLKGLQIQSVQYAAIDAIMVAGSLAPVSAHTNVLQFYDDILDAGGSAVAVSCDASCVFANSVIIDRSTTSANSAVFLKYPAAFTNTTIVCASGVTNSTAIANGSQGAGLFAQGGSFFPPPFHNMTLIGCTNPWAYSLSWSSTANSGNNATDVSSGFTPGTFTPAAGGGAFTSAQLPGTTINSLTPANELANPAIGTTFDARVKSVSSQIYGAGGTFSFSTGGSILGTIVPPSTDILGSARPTSGRYDIGMEQFVPGSTPHPGALILGPFGAAEPANDNEWLRYASRRD